MSFISASDSHAENVLSLSPLTGLVTQTESSLWIPNFAASNSPIVVASPQDEMLFPILASLKTPELTAHIFEQQREHEHQLSLTEILALPDSGPSFDVTNFVSVSESVISLNPRREAEPYVTPRTPRINDFLASLSKTITKFDWDFTLIDRLVYDALQGPYDVEARNFGRDLELSIRTTMRLREEFDNLYLLGNPRRAYDHEQFTIQITDVGQKDAYVRVRKKVVRVGYDPNQIDSDARNLQRVREEEFHFGSYVTQNGSRLPLTRRLSRHGTLEDTLVFVPLGNEITPRFIPKHLTSQRHHAPGTDPIKVEFYRNFLHSINNPRILLPAPVAR